LIACFAVSSVARTTSHRQCDPYASDYTAGYAIREIATGQT
jgi:hypothetical protein